MLVNHSTIIYNEGLNENKVALGSCISLERSRSWPHGLAEVNFLFENFFFLSEFYYLKEALSSDPLASFGFWQIWFSSASIEQCSPSPPPLFGSSLHT